MIRPAARSAFSRLPIIVIGSTLLIFALGILVVTARLRDRLQTAFIGNEAEILVSLTTMLESETAEEFSEEFLHEETAQLNVMLKSTRLKGFLAARLFTPEGDFVSAFPLAGRDGRLSRPVLHRALSGSSTARYLPDLAMDRILVRPPAAPPLAPMAVLEIVIPLRLPDQSEPLAIAQYFMNGEPLAARFEVLNGELFRQAGAVFALGGALIAGSLWWAFARLQRSRRLVAERTRSLLQANRELALASRVSAVGTLATHLLHELKSHLFGLRGVLSTPEVKHTAAGRSAIESSTRMQALVKQLVEVVRNEEGAGTHYEIAARTLLDGAADNAMRLAEKRQVTLRVAPACEVVVNNRSGNLIGIILGHLLQNAIQVSPRGREVVLSCHSRDTALIFRVRDHGPGFPEEQRPWLFQPCNSTKEGGTGIGLALSRQLAAHIGGELTLAESGGNGCVFELILPPAEFESPEATAPARRITTTTP